MRHMTGYAPGQGPVVQGFDVIDVESVNQAEALRTAISTINTRCARGEQIEIISILTERRFAMYAVSIVVRIGA